jgi:hypothetical protein
VAETISTNQFKTGMHIDVEGDAWRIVVSASTGTAESLPRDLVGGHAKRGGSAASAHDRIRHQTREM